MAKKRGAVAISDQLTGSTPPTKKEKWQNHFTHKTANFKRKTYLMTDELIQRIEAQAEAHEVGINEMARYCFDLALSQMETGQHQPEVKEVMTSKRTLEV